MELLNCWLFIFIAINFQICCKTMSVEEELTLTHNQRIALDEFKKEVAGRLPHDYMYEEIFLIKWLRFKNYDVLKAKTGILNMIEWREKNKIDDIEKEDYSDLERQFPYWLDGRDYENRPVSSQDIGLWDPRSALIAGQSERLLRYSWMVLEKTVGLIREDQKNGLNVTQYTVLYNLAGFSLVQHACLQCVPLFVRALISFDQNYPGLLHRIFLINTPSTFDAILRITRPLLSPEYREALAIYGTNKREWREAVLREIPEDQIRPQFGGTKNKDLDDY